MKPKRSSWALPLLFYAIAPVLQVDRAFSEESTERPTATPTATPTPCVLTVTAATPISVSSTTRPTPTTMGKHQLTLGSFNFEFPDKLSAVIAISIMDSYALKNHHEVRNKNSTVVLDYFTDKDGKLPSGAYPRSGITTEDCIPLDWAGSAVENSRVNPEDPANWVITVPSSDPNHPKPERVLDFDDDEAAARCALKCFQSADPSNVWCQATHLCFVGRTPSGPSLGRLRPLTYLRMD